MSNSELLECIECAVPHKCENKCAFCIVDYAFIASEPMLTECGHQICIECVFKIKNKAIKCKFCCQELTSLNLVNKAAELNIRTNLGTLYTSLCKQFSSGVQLFKGKK